MAEQEFEDVKSINIFLDKSRTKLMDINHRVYQEVRRDIERLQDWQDQFNNIIGDMKEALAVGALMNANMVGDMIIEEYDLVRVDEDGNPIDAEGDPLEQEDDDDN